MTNGDKFSVTNTDFWRLECQKLDELCMISLEFLDTFPDQDDKFVIDRIIQYKNYLAEMQEMTLKLQWANKISKSFIL